jgi:hypothetical protein
VSFNRAILSLIGVFSFSILQCDAAQMPFHRGFVRILKKLTDADADLGRRDKHGLSIVFWALNGNQPISLQFLDSIDFDLNVPNDLFAHLMGAWEIGGTGCNDATLGHGQSVDQRMNC